MLSRVILLTWLSSYIFLNAKGSFILDFFRSQNSESEAKSTTTASTSPPIQYGNDIAAARSGGGSGWGWGWHGWPSHGHGHDQNMDLYSLLGGLSFASLLGATIIYLARRNTSGRRRKRDVLQGTTFYDDQDEEIKGGMSMADVLSSISNYIDSPWWERHNSTNNKYEFKIN